MIDKLRLRLTAFLQKAKADAQSGLSLKKIGEMFSELVHLLVYEAFDLDNTGSEKKAFVLEQVGKAFDQIAPSISLPWGLNFFRQRIIAMLRRWVLSIADGTIESAYRLLKPATS